MIEVAVQQVEGAADVGDQIGVNFIAMARGKRDGNGRVECDGHKISPGAVVSCLKRTQVGRFEQHMHPRAPSRKAKNLRRFRVSGLYRSRTDTPLRAQDFESSASAN